MRHSRLCGPDEAGFELRELHPLEVHVEESAVRLGEPIDWAEVRRLALGVEEASRKLPQVTVRHEVACVGDRRSGERCIVSSSRDLMIVYAALCVDVPIVARYQVCGPGAPWMSKEEVANAFHALSHHPASLREPLAALRGVVELDGRGGRRQLLALLDPAALTARRFKRVRKPHLPKAWAFAKRMMSGEWFPAVRVSWDAEQGWRFSGGCHRWWAAHLAGAQLNVTFAGASLGGPGCERAAVHKNNGA